MCMVFQEWECASALQQPSQPVHDVQGASSPLWQRECAHVCTGEDSSGECSSATSGYRTKTKAINLVLSLRPCAQNAA